MEDKPSDKQILKDQIGGLKAAIRTLREDERQHIKLATLTEQIEKARVEAEPLETELQEIRKKRGELKTKKALSLGDTAKKLQDRITKFLPNGTAILRVDEDGIFIGLQCHGENVTPYLSLSGGEKAFFDLAIENALLDGAGQKIILGEVAEIDDNKLLSLLNAIVLQHPDAQILLSTCHAPEAKLPPAWKVVELA